MGVKKETESLANASAKSLKMDNLVCIEQEVC